jgi:hypothetical protein
MGSEEDENTKKMKKFVEGINLDEFAQSLLDSISNTTQMLEESTKRHMKQVINTPAP